MDQSAQCGHWMPSRELVMFVMDDRDGCPEWVLWLIAQFVAASDDDWVYTTRLYFHVHMILLFIL